MSETVKTNLNTYTEMTMNTLTDACTDKIVNPTTGKILVQRGQIRNIGDTHFIYVKVWSCPDTFLVIPVVQLEVAKTSSEFTCKSIGGQKIVAQCWNMRTISLATLARSKPSFLGAISRKERQRMWHVVRYSITGVEVPLEVRDSIGPVTTVQNYIDILRYQKEEVKKAHHLQSDIEW